VERGHGRSRARGREREEAGGGDAVGEDVEFGDGGDVSRFFERAAHQHDLLDSEEGFRVRGRGSGEVGRWAEGDDGDGVGLVVAEQTEDFLVCGFGRGLE
jgi:hypothetical protein